MMTNKFLPLIMLLVIVGVQAKQKNHSALKLSSVRPGRLVVRADFFRQCDDELGSLILNCTRTVDLGVNKGIGISADITLLRPITVMKRGIIKLTSCQDRTYSSCQHFQTWRYQDDACAMWATPNTPWSTIYDAINPRMGCPMAKGVYLVRNATLNVKAISALPFPIDNHHWRVRATAFENGLTICFEVGGYFIRMRNHRH